VIATADVRHVHWQLGQHPEAVKQIAMADRIVLTKCDLGDSLLIAEAEERVQALNPGAEIWQAEPDRLPPGLLEGMSLYAPEGKTADVRHWLNESAIRAQQQLSARQGVFGRPAPAPLHNSTVSTHVLHFSQPFAWADFSRALDTLQSVVGERILRIKGLLAVQGEDAPRIIHAVQHERYPDSTLPAWPDEDRRSRLVFIVNDLPRSVLEKAFSAFCDARAESD